MRLGSDFEVGRYYDQKQEVWQLIEELTILHIFNNMKVFGNFEQ